MAPFTKTTTALALVLGLLAPVAGFAQTTEAPAEDPAAAPAADAANPAGDLSLGVAEGEANGIGSTYVQGTFDAWEQRCIRTESGADPCQLYQLLKDAQGGPVAEIAIFGLPEGTEGPAIAGANVVVPLETLLTDGVSIRIDEAKAKTYPYSVCSTQGCIARIGLTAEEVEAMRKGAGATVTMVPFVAPDQKVELTLSLKGFTAGYQATEDMNKIADEAAAKANAEAAAPKE